MSWLTFGKTVDSSDVWIGRRRNKQASNYQMVRYAHREAFTLSLLFRDLC